MAFSVSIAWCTLLLLCFLEPIESYKTLGWIRKMFKLPRAVDCISPEKTPWPVTATRQTVASNQRRSTPYDLKSHAVLQTVSSGHQYILTHLPAWLASIINTAHLKSGLHTYVCMYSGITYIQNPQRAVTLKCSFPDICITHNQIFVLSIMPWLKLGQGPDAFASKVASVPESATGQINRQSPCHQLS